MSDGLDGRRVNTMSQLQSTFPLDDDRIEDWFSGKDSKYAFFRRFAFRLGFLVGRDGGVPRFQLLNMTQEMVYNT